MVGHPLGRVSGTGKIMNFGLFVVSVAVVASDWGVV